MNFSRSIYYKYQVSKKNDIQIAFICYSNFDIQKYTYHLRAYIFQIKLPSHRSTRCHILIPDVTYSWQRKAPSTSHLQKELYCLKNCHNSTTFNNGKILNTSKQCQPTKEDYKSPSQWIQLTSVSLKEAYLEMGKTICSSYSNSLCSKQNAEKMTIVD